VIDLKEYLEEMIRVPGVSGFEDDIRDYIRGKIEEQGLKAIEDNLGNLRVELGSAGPLVIFVAHMDELGLVVTNLESDGSLRIRKVGGVDDRTLVGRVVEIKTQKGIVSGVIGIKPPHLMTDAEEAKKVVKWQDMRVDVGTRSKKQTEKLGIRVLDPMVLKKDITYITKDLVCARGIDDRAGCAILLDVLEQLRDMRLPIRVMLVWSVQEEIGLRGARAVAFNHRPDYVFAVDTMTTADAPMTEEVYGKCMLGEGPALRMFDSEAIASPKLRKLVEQVAKAARIPLQFGTGGGSTDGAAMQDTGCLMMPLGIVMRYTHSPTEVASISDMENTVKLVVKIVEKLAKDIKRG
jgi:putative aminopeptidase FrvX